MARQLIDQLADRVVERYTNAIRNPGPDVADLDLRSLVWQAISTGMTDAYRRGQEADTLGYRLVKRSK